MGDLISRNALQDAMPKNDVLLSVDVRRIICEAPKVDVEPVRIECWGDAEEEHDRALNCLEKMQFFMGQRAGRELWMSKPKNVQDVDIEQYNHDIETVMHYIRQLENHIGELTAKVSQLDHVTRERDALLELVKELGECNYCKHDSYCPHTIPDCMNCKDENCQCYSCGQLIKWQWRGVQEEGQ